VIDSTKDTLDVVAGSTALMSLFGWLPPVAALFTIIYTGIRIWETKTVQSWRKK